MRVERRYCATLPELHPGQFIQLPCLLHVFCVNVVVADGGGGDELHLAPLQQLLVAACPSSHYQCISVLNVAGRYVGTLQVGNVRAYLAKRLPNIRNLVVNNNLHDS